MKNPEDYNLFNPPPDNYVSLKVSNYRCSYNSHINGLLYVQNFLTETEELNLINTIDNHDWLGALKRRVQHYGWIYDYKARSLNYDMYLGLLPEWAELIAIKIVEQGIMSEKPDQVIINEYNPGQGIANHVDCEPCFGDTIISLSLCSPCMMSFVNLSSKERIEKLLEPRSIIAIKDEARYRWSHGIPARLADEINGKRTNRERRISMTFRKVLIKK